MSPTKRRLWLKAAERPAPPMTSVAGFWWVFNEGPSVSAPPCSSHTLLAHGLKIAPSMSLFFRVIVWRVFQISSHACLSAACNNLKSLLRVSSRRVPCIFQGRIKKKQRAQQCGKLIEAPLLWTSVIKRPISWWLRDGFAACFYSSNEQETSSVSLTAAWLQPSRAACLLLLTTGSLIWLFLQIW